MAITTSRIIIVRGSIAVVLLSLLTIQVSSDRAEGADHFYVMIFGTQSDPKQLRLCHSFATFVRATGEGPDPAGYAVTQHSISWFPRNLDVRLRRLRPEPGINLDLDSTIRLVMRDGESVTMWGPYRITPEIYNRSIDAYNKLNAGEEFYRAIDGPFNAEITNCIHAVGDIDPVFGRRRYPLDKVGKPASAYLAKQLIRRSSFDQSEIDNGWLIPRLGLHQYPIEYVGNQGSPRLGHYALESHLSRLRTIGTFPAKP